MENVECFNEKNESLHQTLPRSAMKNADVYFRVLHAWIRNDAGEFLVQKRAKKDDSNPYMWAFTTGMPEPFEDPLEGLIREVKEEIGWQSQKADWQFVKIVPTHVHPYKTFAYIYETRLNELKTFQKNGEVSTIEWWDLKTIQDAIKNNRFWDYPALLNAASYFQEVDDEPAR